MYTVDINFVILLLREWNTIIKRIKMMSEINISRIENSICKLYQSKFTFNDTKNSYITRNNLTRKLLLFTHDLNIIMSALVTEFDKLMHTVASKDRFRDVTIYIYYDCHVLLCMPRRIMLSRALRHRTIESTHSKFNSSRTNNITELHIQSFWHSQYGSALFLYHRKI